MRARNEHRRSPIALLRDRRGAAAVEFGVVAVPFVILVLGIFELALVFLASGLLDSATAEAARTAGMGNSVPSEAAIAAQICAGMPALGRDCDSALRVGLDQLGAGSGQSDIVIVRAVYDWPLVTPLIGRALPSGEGTVAFVATSAFRLEGS